MFNRLSSMSNVVRTLQRRWASLDRRVRIAAPVLVVLAAAATAAALVLALRDGGDDCAAPLCVEVLAPMGEDVAPMTPVRIRLQGELDRDAAVQALRITNEPAGDKRFEGDVLTFRPQWPGFARGVDYDVALQLPLALVPTGAEPVDVRYRFSTEGKLQVTSVFPQDGAAEIALDAAIMVQFNRSVASLTVIAERGPQGIVKFSPPIEGEGRWLNTSLYTFRPAAGWAPATTYAASVTAGLANKLGSQLEADYAFTFSTLSPAVAQISPPDNSTFVSPSPEIVVTFNQPVDRASAQAAVTIGVQGGAAVAGTFAWQDDTRLTFRPQARLALGATYETTVSIGVRARDASVLSTAEARSHFQTVGVPRVASTTPASGDDRANRYGIAINFTNPMDQQSVEDAFALFPPPESDVFFYWGEDGLRVDVGVSFDPSAAYRFTLATAAKDRYGQPLATPADVSFTTAPMEPQVSIFRSGMTGTFNSYLDPTIIASSWNLGQLDLELYSIDRNALIAYERGERTGAPARSALLREWSETIAAPPLDRAVTTATRLAAPGERLPQGVYFLRVIGHGTIAGDAMPFVVSSANVTTKWTERELLAWAVDMQTAAPIRGLPVEVLSEQGSPIASGTTNDDGVARINVGTVQNVYPGFYVSARQGDLVVLSGTAWNGSIGYGGVPYTFNPERYAGHLYTDRPIYRPSETVEIKGIVRADDDARYSLPPGDQEFRLQINDSRGREIYNESVTLSDMGTFDASLPLSDAADTGDYYGWLSTVLSRSADSPPQMEARQFAYLSFKVAEFRKPEFEVEVGTDKDSYVNGETIHATAQASLFFGAPLAGATVKWQVNAQSYFFRSEEFPGHRFGDFGEGRFYYDDGPFFDPEQHIRLQGESVLDAAGAVSVEVPADVASDPTSRNFVFEAAVTDQNGQTVGAFTGVPVHKGLFYIGVRPEEYVSTAGEASSVSVVTVDTEDVPVANVPVAVTIFERKWRTIRERDADGQQRYRSEPEDTLVQTLDVRTGTGGSGTLTFTPQRSGEHRVVATATDGAGNTVRTATSFWVSGGEFASWRIGNDDVIELIPDKDEYEPGDTARILVAAPFSGSTGLITQERGRLMSYDLQSFTGNSETIDVPITSDHIPNVYVGVVLFKAPTAENPRPQARFGLVELRVATDEKKLNVSVEPDRDRLGPREKVTYKVRTTNSRGEGVPAELSLALVDKSVLALQDDPARPALEAFWSRRPLGVLTGSMFAVSIDRANELTINRLQGGGKGGGGGAADQTRTFFPNTAYWDPSLRTDDHGEATVEVDLPDTLTTWRMTARAITIDTLAGEARSEIVTSKEVVVRPAVPRFLVVDDQAALGAIVHNFAEGERQLEVSLSAEGIEIDGDATQRVTVGPGGDALVRWNTRALAGYDSVSLTFEANGGGSGDAVKLDLPLYAFVTPETVATAGSVTGEASEVIEVPYYVRRDAGELTVRVSPSLASGVNTALAYIEEYPWESAETTVSRFLPRLALQRAVGELGLTDVEAAPADALVRRSLQRLYGDQKDDGGFGWFRLDESDSAVTAYVLIGFAEAERSGFAVDAQVVQNAVGYLRGQLDLPRDVAAPAYDVRAYMLYALARAGDGDLGRTFALAEQRASLSNTAKAWTAIAIGDAGGSEKDPRLTSLLSDLQTAAIASATGNHWEDAVYDPNVFGNSTQTTAQVLQAFVRYLPDHPLTDGTLRWLMVARKDGRWESTHDTSAALLAITDFMLVRKDAQASFRYRVELNGDNELSGSAKRGEVHQSDEVVIAMEDLLVDAANELRIERSPGSAAGRLYYTAHLRYFTPAENIESLSRGIGVSHEYFRADAEGDIPVSAVGLGEAVRVRVTLVAESDLNFLVLEDFLPAGLEPIDTTLKTTPPDVRRQLFEEQRRSYQVSKRYSPFGHTDIRDNRVALFARFVPKGVYEYTYFAQATTPGEFRVAPATAYEQYFPEVFGRSDGGVFTVDGEAPGASGTRSQSTMRDVAQSRLGPPLDAALPGRGPVMVRRRRHTPRRSGVPGQSLTRRSRQAQSLPAHRISNLQRASVCPCRAGLTS